MWGKTRGKKTARDEGKNVERSADARISNENVKPGWTALIPFGVGVWRDRWNFYLVRFGLSGIPRPLIGGLWPRPAYKGGLLAGALSTLMYARCEYTYVYVARVCNRCRFRAYICIYMCVCMYVGRVHRRRNVCTARGGALSLSLSQDCHGRGSRRWTLDTTRSIEPVVILAWNCYLKMNDSPTVAILLSRKLSRELSGEPCGWNNQNRSLWYFWIIHRRGTWIIFREMWNSIEFLSFIFLFFFSNY